MKKVDAKLSNLYLHNTKSTTDPSNDPSNEKGGRHKDDGGMRDRLHVHLRDHPRVCLSDGHSFIAKVVVDLRPMDIIKCGMGGIDSSYFWYLIGLRVVQSRQTTHLDVTYYQGCENDA